jgi:hypothetical protein
MDRNWQRRALARATNLPRMIASTPRLLLVHAPMRLHCFVQIPNRAEQIRGMTMSLIEVAAFQMRWARADDQMILDAIKSGRLSVSDQRVKNLENQIAELDRLLATRSDL